MALALLYVVPLSWVIWHSRFYSIEGLDKKWVVSAFLLKVTAGLALWAIYTFYYSGAPRETLDTFKYFDDAGYMHAALANDPVDWLRLMFNVQLDSPSLVPYYEGMNNWNRPDNIIAINDHRTMVRINALIRLISFGEYHVHSILFNFLGFTGLLLSFKAMRRMTPLPARLFLVAFILPPSLLFWASGVLKESIVLLAMGVLLHGFAAWWVGEWKRRHLLWMISGVLLFMFIKPYALFSFLPALLFLTWCRRKEGGARIGERMRRSLSTVGKWGLLHAFLLLGFLIGGYFPAIDPLSLLSARRDAFMLSAKEAAATSAIDIPTLDSFSDLLIALPQALFTALFRPTVFEADSAILCLAATENTAYFILLLLAVFFCRKKGLAWSVILFCLSVVMVMSAIIGLVTPVLGAVVRYKVPMLPFLLVMIYLLIDFDRSKGGSASSQ